MAYFSDPYHPAFPCNLSQNEVLTRYQVVMLFADAINNDKNKYYLQYCLISWKKMAKYCQDPAARKLCQQHFFAPK